MSLRFVLPICAAVIVACSATETTPPASSNGGAAGAGASNGSGGGGGDATVTVGAGGGDGCACTPGPHNDLIYLLSQDGEIWSYDPETNASAYVRTLLCTGTSNTFSMAIDQRGDAWVLSASTDLIFTFDLEATQGCEVSPYTPHTASYDLFGMSFSNPDDGGCPQLYTHSYSGTGFFTEGAAIGTLGVIDPESGVLSSIAPIDYDGGELAGSGDGRLFAFAGVNPAKLVEYDKENGQVISTTPLTGVSKTLASAFAFFAGDIYFFTESLPTTCLPCLTANCNTELQACLLDPTCTDHLNCAIVTAGVSDDCGGAMPAALQTCLTQTCLTECFLPPLVRVSKVTHMDFDESGGNGKELTVLGPDLSIRVVGAGDSVCVPAAPL